ncbi:NmrA family NAD(P)-binding protein [Hymenobacter ginsengisoli]|uniref:NmrA family NAD(P)-binding protein n=1 Tax=Hymenobacter ginsengisoli TaxID=1051626 RepID=A0ABP8Q2C5_9BACT|nr:MULTISPECIES: NAD(P)H-binding protein [unclassified Hymenobacter]MBO2032439.1 NAD(P)H-binding protein [Hymenobacter sp. BT559]
MKIIVTGSLGNISKPLATELVQQGHAVTVISSQPDRQPAIEALGATAAIGSLDDADFLAATFAGADAVYTMVPPSYGELDSRAYFQRIGRNYAQAIQQAGVGRVVQLSSWGAHRDHGTGGILGSHDVEEILAAVPGLALTHLRPTSFLTNYYGFVGMIKGAGFLGANCAGNYRVALVHPRDIAAAATEELTKPATAGRIIRYVASDERTQDEVAHALGAAIGRPDLRWVAFSDEQMRENLLKNGLPPSTAADVVDIYASMNSGALAEDYEQHKPALGKVKLEDFAKEFAAAFQSDSQR